MLSWDLHVHPGPPEEGRWGDGTAVRAAARRAGVKGLVWKSHSGSTATSAHALSPGRPHVIPSIVLNASITTDDLSDALAHGVRWIWSPSRERDGSLGWELPLPGNWDEVVGLLRDVAEPVVLATSHLAAAGRRACALLASEVPSILCSVTHSLYLRDDEVTELGLLGAVFEADLYTMVHRVRDVSMAPLGARADLVRSLGSTLYLTSDAGQAAVGDPYVFVRDALHSLHDPLGDQLEDLTTTGPERVVRHLVPDLFTASIGRDSQ